MDNPARPVGRYSIVAPVHAVSRHAPPNAFGYSAVPFIAIFYPLCILVATMLQIKALKRDTTENAQELRAQGIVPAVMYGPKQEATSIKFEASVFEKVYKEAGESTIVDLEIGGEPHDVLIHAIDRDPVRDSLVHVDFYAIEKGKKLTVPVHLSFDGVAPAEKSLGGVLVKVVHEIEIEAMPRDLPHELHVDLSVLVDFDTQIHIRDIVLPSGVEVTANPDDVVALVQPPKGEESEEPVEAPDMSQIEVVGKKKEEETPAE